MGPKLALFFCISLLFTTTFVEMRMIPGRARMFSNPDISSLSGSFRYLEDAPINKTPNKNATGLTQPLTMRLRGNTELGYYYVTLFFGTPLQKQTLIVDTGSSTTTIPCQECGDHCGKNHFDLPFNHDNSETFEPFQCQESFGDYTCNDCSSEPCGFGVSYVEGSSYKGHFTRDYVSFGNEIEDYFSLLTEKELEQIDKDEEDKEDKSRRVQQDILQDIINQRKTFVPFGCTTRETKLFFEQEADGIFGLGVNTNTRSSPPNLLDAMIIKDPSFDSSFSICLAQDGGYLTVGGFNTVYHDPKEKIFKTKYYDEYGQYRVYIKKLEMEGKDMGLSVKTLNHGDGAFFDSGTTLTHMPSENYNAVRNHMSTFCAKGKGNCGNNLNTAKEPFCWTRDKKVFPVLQDFLKTFPTFKFYFGKDGEAEYEWKAEDYLYTEKNSNKYCLGLAKYDRETILGGTFMKNHDVVFDKKHKIIGFARANCSAVNDVVPLIGPNGEKMVLDQHTGEPDSTNTNPFKKDQDQPKPSPNEQNNGDETTNLITTPDENWDIIKKVVIALGISTVVGILIYIIIKSRRNKTTYFKDIQQDIELPSAGKGVETSFDGVIPKINNEGIESAVSSSSDVGIAI